MLKKKASEKADTTDIKLNRHENFDSMRKIITISLIIVLTAGTGLTACSSSTGKKKTETAEAETAATIKKGAEYKNTNSGAVTGLIREYNLTEGFETVSVGGLGLGLIKMIAKPSMDEEERAALEIMDGLRRIVVLDYEEADSSKRESFTRKMTDILDRAEKILEVKDEEDILNIYGTCADDGDSIDDLMIFSPGDCSLICLFGSISSQKVADLIEMAND